MKYIVTLIFFLLFIPSAFADQRAEGNTKMEATVKYLIVTIISPTQKNPATNVVGGDILNVEVDVTHYLYGRPNNMTISDFVVKVGTTTVGISSLIFNATTQHYILTVIVPNYYAGEKKDLYVNATWLNVWNDIKESDAIWYSTTITPVPSGGGAGGFGAELDFDVRNISIDNLQASKADVTVTVENKGWKKQVEITFSQRIIQQSTNMIVSESTETLGLDAGISMIKSSLVTTSPFESGLYRYECTVAYKKNPKIASASSQLIFRYWGEVPPEFQPSWMTLPNLPKLPQFNISPEMVLIIIVVICIIALFIAIGSNNG